MTNGYTLTAMRQAISDPRFAPYLREASDDEAAALELYKWNGRMTSAAYELIAHAEVFLRNAIDRALTEHYRDDECGIPWLLREPPLDAEAMRRVTDVRDRLRTQHRESRHQIVAGLSFGFWSGMLGNKYEEEWRLAIRHAFPGGNGTRKQATNLVEAIRKFRNRLAHHDSVLGLDIPFEVQRVHELATLLGNEPAEWLRAADRTSDIYRERPVTSIDTVVVGARQAWPLYEQERAYVCQAGRWFRPVTRLAFYTNHEIKADVPLIRHRRDNVAWDEEHAIELSQGSREDRKIASVIRASRDLGWTAGVYQVFLLTRPGDKDHRTLPNVIHHHASGRGSAFTQGQRYVSLHALETATTTEDLL